MSRFVPLTLLCGLLFSAVLPVSSQVSTTAVRVLGQEDLRQNGLNSVTGGELFNPSSVATDTRGGVTHVYISDFSNNRILAWRDAASHQNGARADLVLGQSSFQVTVGRGIGARGLFLPQGLAVQASTGDLYVADSGNNRILRFPSPFENTASVEPDAVYGQPDFNSFNANNGGLSIRSLNNPFGVAFDRTGNLWIVDGGNQRVLRYPLAALEGPAPEADLVLGQEDFESRVANAPAPGGPKATGFNTPTSIAFHPDGSLYVADFTNSRVLVFTAPFTTFQEASRVILQENFQSNDVSPSINAGEVRGPNGIAIDSAGTLYVVAQLQNRILVFDDIASAVETPMADSVIGQRTLTLGLPNVDTFPRAAADNLLSPGDMSVDAAGNLYIVDTGNHRVLFYEAGATAASKVFGQDDFQSNGANRIEPGSVGRAFGVVVDYSAEPFPVYVADQLNNRVLGWRSSLRFTNGTPADIVIGQADLTTSIANSDTGRSQSPRDTSLSGPRGLAIDELGNLWVADRGNNRVLRFRRPVDQEGRIRADVVLGQPGFVSSLSAAVSASSLSSPSDVALGPDGGVFVADTGNHRVLQYSPSPTNGAPAIRVFGQLTFVDGTAPNTVTAQSLLAPEGVYVDPFGVLFVADTGVHRVLAYPVGPGSPATGSAASSVLGQPDFENIFTGSSAFRLSSPRAVTTDSLGNIYVADSGNNRILTFDPLFFLPAFDAAANAVVGQPNLTNNRANYNSVDGLATPQGLSGPSGFFMDRNDTLYVGDTSNSRVVHFLRPGTTVNAATFTPGIAGSPGSLVTLFGSGLTGGESAAAVAIPLPKELVGRRIEVAGREAALLFLNDTQANFQLPVETPLGLQTVAVRRADTDELISGSAAFIDFASPGLFTFTQDGLGRTLAINQDGTLNGPDNPALRGTVIQLFGTGQGPTVPVVPDGEPAPSSPLALSVATPQGSAFDCAVNQPSICGVVGSQFAQVTFSGLAPGFVGLWQVNMLIPDVPELVTGDAVIIRLVINSRFSNSVLISIR